MKKTMKKNIRKTRKKNTSCSSKIRKVMEFIKKLEGTPYKLINKRIPPKRDSAPFWIGPGDIPSINKIRKDGLICVGVANLCRRLMHLEIPGKITNYKPKNKELEKWIGGTGAWFDYLSHKKRLKKINFKKTYPEGTLLLQNFNIKDQGHVAIIINDNPKEIMTTDFKFNFFHGRSNIIHAIKNPKGYKTGVLVEPLLDYWNYKRFTHVCLPEDWLCKN